MASSSNKSQTFFAIKANAAAGEDKFHLKMEALKQTKTLLREELILSQFSAERKKNACLRRYLKEEDMLR